MLAAWLDAVLLFVLGFFLVFILNVFCFNCSSCSSCIIICCLCVDNLHLQICGECVQKSIFLNDFKLNCTICKMEILAL